MARQQALAGENNFVAGLVTETTALRFPPNACTDTDNCVFDETGRVTRRLGLDLEEDASLLSADFTEGEAMTEYLWESVAGDGNTTFLVQQQGSTLRFYDLSDGNAASSNNTGLTINLNSHLAEGSALDPAMYPCQYAQGLGRLLVVSRAIEPLYLEYSEAGLEITATEIDIRIRDFVGLEDGLEDGERPASTVADLITDNPAHYYNLLNQGWFAGDALAQWDTGRADLPSNRDYVALFRASFTDAFDNTRVTANTPGTRLASKGHFKLSAWCPNYTQALADEGFTATVAAGDNQISVIPGTNATLFGTLAGGNTLVELFQGTTNRAASSCATSLGSSGFGGATFSVPKRITKAIVYGSNNHGYRVGGDGSTTITLYGKQGASPTIETDGTSLGSITFTDTSNESEGRVITSSDTTTNWKNVWINVVNTAGGEEDQVCVAELVLFTSGINEDSLFCTPERPQTVEFFAGRAWYAGVEFGRLSNSIYFSQIVEKASQLGECYQANDPSSEEFTDLLADDGGVIKIPEVARIVKLFAYQTTLLVIATNGIWAITGSSQAGFLATDFAVRKISSVGSSSPQSVISIKGVPVWWGEDGIWTVSVDNISNSFATQNISDERIKSFITDISAFNRQFVKGAYNINEGVGVWLFNDDDALAAADRYKYNRALVINGLNGAFYPWTFNSEEALVRGVVYAKSPIGNTPALKFVASVDIDSDTSYFTFAEIYNNNYKDWAMLTDLLETNYTTDYTSYFITGYRVDGQVVKKFQPRYVYVYLESGDCVSSCFMQGIFDFTNASYSGKWSTLQQVFRPRNHHDISCARLKVRGKGKAMQLRFISESGKPFTIIGWGIPESIAGDI